MSLFLSITRWLVIKSEQRLRNMHENEGIEEEMSKLDAVDDGDDD